VDAKGRFRGEIWGWGRFQGVVVDGLWMDCGQVVDFQGSIRHSLFIGHLFVRFPRALGRALGFWRVPLVGFALATGRIPFGGTLGVGVSLGR